MAIIPMKKVVVVGIDSCQDEALLRLQKSNVLHIVASKSMQGGKASEIEANKQAVSKLVSAISFLHLTEEAPKDNIPWTEIVTRIRKANEDIALHTDNIRNLESAFNDVRPWGEFDVSKLESLKKSGFHTQFFVISASELEKSRAALAHHAHEVVHSESGQMYVVTIGSERISLKGREFQAPTESLSTIKAKLEREKENLANSEKQLDDLSVYLPQLDNELQFREACLQLKGKETVFMLQGWVPADSVDLIEPALRGLPVASQISDPQEGDRVPTLRRNKDLVAGPGEMLSDIYSQPQHNEWDPSIMLMVWFGFFFGICVGDAGYGLMFLLLWFVLKKKFGSKMKQAGKRFLNMAFWLSLSTVIMGVATGTVFGFDVTASEKCPPFFTWLSSFVQFDNLASIMGLPLGTTPIMVFMVFALYIGAVHISTAHLVTIYKAFRDKELIHSVGPFFLICLIWFGIFAYKTETPWVVNTTYVVAVLSIIFVGISGFISDGPVSGVISGVFAPISTFGDLMSYLRLFALGLASGLLGAAFNSIAGMVVDIGAEDSVVSSAIFWILAGIIWCLAHMLNVALAIMGGTVHGLRLNMLEFYRWCFVGDGVKYKPLYWNKISRSTGDSSVSHAAVNTVTKTSELTSIKGE